MKKEIFYLDNKRFENEDDVFNYIQENYLMNGEDCGYFFEKYVEVEEIEIDEVALI